MTGSRQQTRRTPSRTPIEQGEALRVGTPVAELVVAVTEPERPAATMHLMEEVCERENLVRAWQRVRGNKGAPGVDAMTVDDAVGYLREHWPDIRSRLLSGYDSNPKTVAKWRKRTSVADLQTGPKEPKSTVLSVGEKAVIVAFRRYTLLPLGDCLHALQPTIPHLTRSTLHRSLQRHGVGHDQLRKHLANFVTPCNFGRRPKTLKGLSPDEFICKRWTSQPERFRLNPLHQMPGLNS
jgi:hypothetical protein